jgi:Tfp pilus assembly protein PilF
VSDEQIAAELDVNSLLRGSVTRTPGRIRVSLELVDVEARRVEWRQSFERPAAELLALREEVLREVARQVQARLAPLSEVPAVQRTTSKQDAYDAYLRGQFETLGRNPAAFARAVEHFLAAIRLDSEFAPAYAGLAWARLQQSNWAGRDRPRAHAVDVMRALTRALVLDPELAEAHVARGLALRVYDLDWTGSEASIRRAIDINPNLAMAHSEYAMLLRLLGRFADAVSEAQAARRLDPAPTYWANEADVLSSAGRFAEAHAALQRALALDPDYRPALHRLVRLHLRQRQLGEARRVLTDLERRTASGSLTGLQAQLEALSGNTREARRLLMSLDPVRSSTFIATTLAIVGDRAEMFAAVRRTLETGNTVFGARELDPYRSDPEFLRLLQEARLPPASVTTFLNLASPRSLASAVVR